MCQKNYKGQCTSCPVHPWTEAGVLADSYGCLPSVYDMSKWQRETGKVWACHSNPKKPCSGFVGFMKENNVKYDLSKRLITESCTIEEIYKDIK